MNTNQNCGRCIPKQLGPENALTGVQLGLEDSVGGPPLRVQRLGERIGGVSAGQPGHPAGEHVSVTRVRPFQPLAHAVC